jgi:hypothetical protein
MRVLGGDGRVEQYGGHGARRSPCKHHSFKHREIRMTDSSDKAHASEGELDNEPGTTIRETPDETEGTVKDDASANPPRTTSLGWLTVPKFGSAGSGGAELEPGPERD